MPIEFLYTDSELLKLRKRLLKKYVLTKEELSTLSEINAYCNNPNS